MCQSVYSVMLATSAKSIIRKSFTLCGLVLGVFSKAHAGDAGETINIINNFNEVEATDSTWVWKENFGHFDATHWPWLWHQEHGWQFCEPSAADSGWLWDTQLGWLWPSPDSETVFWSKRFGWIEYFSSDDRENYYFSFSLGVWLNIEEDEAEVEISDYVASLKPLPLVDFSDDEESEEIELPNLDDSEEAFGDEAEDIAELAGEIDDVHDHMQELQDDVSELFDSANLKLADMKQMLEAIDESGASESFINSFIESFNEAMRDAAAIREILDEMQAHGVLVVDLHAELKTRYEHLLAVFGEKETKHREQVLKTGAEWAAEREANGLPALEALKDEVAAGAVDDWTQEEIESVLEKRERVEELLEAQSEQWENIETYTLEVVECLEAVIAVKDPVVETDEQVDGILEIYRETHADLAALVADLMEVRDQFDEEISANPEFREFWGGSGSIGGSWISFNADTINIEAGLIDWFDSVGASSDTVEEVIELDKDNLLLWEAFADLIAQSSETLDLEEKLDNWSEAARIAYDVRDNLWGMLLFLEDMSSEMEPLLPYLRYEDKTLFIEADGDIAILSDIFAGATVTLEIEGNSITYDIPDDMENLHIETVAGDIIIGGLIIDLVDIEVSTGSGNIQLEGDVVINTNNSGTPIDIDHGGSVDLSIDTSVSISLVGGEGETIYLNTDSSVTTAAGNITLTGAQTTPTHGNVLTVDHSAVETVTIGATEVGSNLSLSSSVENSGHTYLEVSTGGTINLTTELLIFESTENSPEITQQIQIELGNGNESGGGTEEESDNPEESNSGALEQPDDGLTVNPAYTESTETGSRTEGGIELSAPNDTNSSPSDDDANSGSVITVNPI